MVKIGVAYTLEGLAGVEAAQGRMQQAARLLGASAAFRAEADAPPQSFLARHADADRAAIRDALGEAAFAAEWAAGRHTPTKRIVTFVLGEDT